MTRWGGCRGDADGGGRLPLPAGVGLTGEDQDGGAGLVAQRQGCVPAGAGGRDRIGDGDVEWGPVREPAARAEEFAAAPDARRDDRGAGGRGGLERAEVEGPQPGGGVQCPFRPDREAAAAGQDSSQVRGAGGGLLRLGPVDELGADPSQEQPGDAPGGEFLRDRETGRVCLACCFGQGQPVPHDVVGEGALADPRIIRRALDGLAIRLDGNQAAATTIARKRAVFSNCLGSARPLQR